MAQMTTRDTHEKRARFEAAPAASPARHVGPHGKGFIVIF